MIIPFGKHRGKSVSQLKLYSIRWYLGYDVHNGEFKLPSDQDRSRLFVRYKYSMLYQEMFVIALQRRKCLKCLAPLKTIEVDYLGRIYILHSRCLNKYFTSTVPINRNVTKLVLSQPVEECMICMDDSTEPVRIMPCCSQVIHNTCLNNWKRSTCPFCRKDISELKNRLQCQSVLIDNADTIVQIYLNNILEQ